jgi:MFS family permease
MQRSRADSWRALAFLCLASAGWAFSFGLGAPLSALWLRDAGSSAHAIGLNTSAYYLGVALTSVFVPGLIRRHARFWIVAGMMLDAATTAAFPYFHGMVAWNGLRLLGGAGTALSLIPMETLVNQNSPDDRRARDFGVYAVCVALGIALGGVIGLRLYQNSPRFAFIIGGMVTLAATAVAWFGIQGETYNPVETAVPAAPTASMETGPAVLLGLGTAWVQGFLEAGLFSFLSIYLLWLGYKETGASALAGALLAGVVLAQFPVAWLADRLGRLRVLLACHALVALALAATPFCLNAVPLAAWLFLLGACCGALYPLGLALLGERISPAGLAKANAYYLASNCAGSLVGPVVLGFIIDRYGQHAQFAGGVGAVLVVLAVWFAWMTRQARSNQGSQRLDCGEPRQAA